jgi:glycosyltransferase involved in cell wall biosynthesis
MKIHLQDFAGHPFQAQLSRALADRGHTVEHSYAIQYLGGKGVLSRRTGDPTALSFVPISARHPLIKYSIRARLRFERSYVKALTGALLRNRPDVVVLTNVPLMTAYAVRKALARHGIPVVLWHQDLLSVAMAGELHAQLPGPVARILAAELRRREKEIVERVAAVVPIDGSFVTEYQRWGVQRSEVHVLPNWAPLDEIVPVPRDGAWSRRNELRPDAFRLLYSGTLGRKHNPLLLLDLLEAMKARGVDAELIVVSEGEGADMVAGASNGSRSDVRVLPFQPAADLSATLGSADVLVAVLEPMAGRFSVPSKVLSYLAAGRPVLGLMPADNAASRDLTEAGGFVASPDKTGVELAADWMKRLSDNPAELDRISKKSRDLAESRFNIVPIAQQFERIALRAAAHRDYDADKCSEASRPPCLDDEIPQIQVTGPPSPDHVAITGSTQRT